MKDKGPITQKEAVFRIIKEGLGDKYFEGVNAKEILSEGLFRRGMAYTSPALDRIRDRIQAGLLNTQVPFEGKLKDLKPDDWVKRMPHYANTIMHYWLRHDKRLNGGQDKQIFITVTKLPERYFTFCADDKKFDALMTLIEQLQDENDPQKKDVLDLSIKYLHVHCCHILLRALGVDLTALGPDIARAIGYQSESKKEAA